MSQYNITPKKVEPGLLLAAEAVRELQFDFAIIELTVLSERVLFKASDVKASAELNAISEKLRAHGIERDDVLVTPKRLGRGSGFSSRKGERYDLSLSVLCKKPKSLPAILSALAKLKGVTIDDIKWRLENVDPIANELALEATRSVCQQAQEIADASPANLGALIGLSVSSPSLREKAESISYELHDAGLETALDAYRLAKNCEIRVQVSALFELHQGDF